MQIKIKGARIIDPGNLDAFKDIIIKDGLISDIIEPGADDSQNGLQVVDAQGKIVVPGLIDIHVHLREPGHEYKETIETGAKAAAKGGFTLVCSMPNTDPVNDNAQVTTFIISRAKQAGSAKVLPAGAITVGLKGENLSEIYEMKQAGAVAVTDDGRPVESSNMMRRALEYCRDLDLPVFVHAEDLSLADGGSMNEGETATLYGIKGIPNSAESVMVVRDIELAELTDSSVHFCHISTWESIEAIRQAKARGIKVTCETAPHYFTLTDADIRDYDTHFKMNPPLRSEKDRQSVIKGLADGTIDAIASDHAPHSAMEKDVEFDMAAFGIIGLETSLPLSLKLVQEGFLTMDQLIEKMSKAPARIIGLNNDLTPGKKADLTIIDPDKEYIIDPETFESRSRNTPFAGFKVRGKAVMTMVEGKIAYTEL